MIDKLLHHAVTTAPKVLRLPIGLVPFELYQKPMRQALEHVFKSQLEEGELDFLEDRWLQVEVTDLNWCFCVSVQDEQMRVEALGRECDVQFRACSQDLLLIAARRQDPDTLFFQRRLMISGDTELGLAIKNLIDSVEWEQLPKPLGWALNSAAAIVSRANAYVPAA